MTVRPGVRWYIALPLSILGGVLLDAAAPELAWWPAAFIGVAFVSIALWQQTFWLGVLTGAVAGAAFWGPHISWLTLYLGPIPWLGLCSVMVLWYALMGGAIAIATRGYGALLRGRRVSRWACIALQSATVAGLWVAREQVQSTWPYGGFAWGRLAHTQADGPFAALVSWLGFSGVSGMIALMCAVPIALWWSSSAERGRAPAAVGTAAVVVVAFGLSFVPVASLPHLAEIRIAAVQGDSKSAIFDDRENGDVFRDHYEQTVALLDELERSNDSVDVIVWPENSAEFDLLGNDMRMRALAALSERAEAPILAGTILEEHGVYTNSAVVIDADGFTGERYDKRRPVPFAEYMPNRAFFRSLVPDLVDLVQLDYAFGMRGATLEFDTPSHLFRAGIAICFDIIFDDQAVAMVDGGAQIIFAPTNNADFGTTDQSAQQLQIAHLRAIETGRALVNISTVGTSAVVQPDGELAAGIPTHEPGWMLVDAPLVEGMTPALRWGAWIAGLWIVIALAGTAIGIAAERIARRALSRSADRSDAPAAV